MSVAWSTVAKLGLLLAIIGTLWALLRWVLKRAEDKKQAEDQVAELQANLARSEAARNKELQIANATRKVRDAPGPVVPGIGELSQPPGGPGPAG